MEAKCLAIAHAELGGIAVHRAAHRRLYLLKPRPARICSSPPRQRASRSVRPTMRQPRALRTGLQAVKTLHRVLWQQQSLETAFEHSKAALPAYEHGTLRDLCSGTLRHWHYYAAVIESLAPPAASDDARLLMATTLYQGEHMRSSTQASRAKLLARAEACCEALQLPQERQAVREVCSRALALTPQDRQALHTAASALSLPEWLHTRLAAETPLPSYGELLLRRPDFLALCDAVCMHAAP